MKKFFTLIAILIFTITLFGQAPQGINYQAVARDANGMPLEGFTGSVEIRILDAFDGQLYKETHSIGPTPLHGLFNLVIGQGTNQQGSFSNIDWASGAKILGVKIGGNQEVTQPIMSVPYALYAAKTNLQAGPGIGINGNQITNLGDSDNDPSNELQDLTLNGNTLTLSNGGGSVQLPTSSITIQQGNGISVSQNGSTYTISNTGDTNGNDDIKIGDFAGGDLNGTFPNPTVDGIQGVPVSSSTPQQGQVMMYDNGQWKAVALPSQAPEIAIFEERTNSGFSPPAVLNDNSWNKRILSHVAKSSNSVELNGPNLKFNQAGTYLITASAPAFQSIRHKLCLREVGTNVIKITGTSEYTASTAPNSGHTSRSFIMGVLVVTNLNNQYFLDHYIQNNGGGNNGLGVETSIPNPTLEEVYAQIMIQKIQ